MLPAGETHFPPSRRLAVPLQGEPGLLVLDFERTEIDAHLHLERARETRWYSPRVPACTTSAIREFALIDDSSLFIDDAQPGSR